MAYLLATGVSPPSVFAAMRFARNQRIISKVVFFIIHSKWSICSIKLKKSERINTFQK